jgi:hypothetical protein
MSESNAGSATTQESSGSSETKSEDKVAYETYKRVLSEAKKLKEQVKANEELIAKTNEQKLKEQNEWKVLAENYKKQLDDKAKHLDDLNSQVVNGMKYQEFEKHLGGKLKNKDYATFIDFERIVMNPETKTIDEESVKGVVGQFVKQHSHLVEFQTGARLPNESGKSETFKGKSPNEMSPDEIKNELRKLGKL